MRVELSRGEWAEVNSATVRTWREQQRSGAVLVDQSDVMIDLAARCISEWSRGDVSVAAIEGIPLGDFNKIMLVVNGDDSPLVDSPERLTATVPIHGSGDSDSSAKPASRRHSDKP